MRQAPRYELIVEYRAGADGLNANFVSEEDTQQEAFLLAAKIIGFYQAHGGFIYRILLKDNKEGKYVDLPRGLTSLYW